MSIIFTLSTGTLPGPRRLPFVGSAKSIEKDKQHRSFNRLQQQYGRVVGLFLGPMPTILVGGYESVTEALMNQDLNGRPSFMPLIDIFGEHKGNVRYLPSMHSVLGRIYMYSQS